MHKIVNWHQIHYGPKSGKYDIGAGLCITTLLVGGVLLRIALRGGCVAVGGYLTGLPGRSACRRQRPAWIAVTVTPASDELALSRVFHCGGGCCRGRAAYGRTPCASRALRVASRWPSATLDPQASVRPGGRQRGRSETCPAHSRGPDGRCLRGHHPTHGNVSRAVFSTCHRTDHDDHGPPIASRCQGAIRYRESERAVAVPWGVPR